MKLLIKEYLVKFNDEGEELSREFVKEFNKEVVNKDDLYELLNLSEIFEGEGREEGFDLGVMRLMGEEEINDYEFKEVY